MLFAVLLASHLLSDYPLQPNWLVARKNHWSGLLIHGMIVGVTMVMLLLPLLPEIWPALIVISGVHTIQDWLKVRVGNWLPGAPLVPYLVDQGAHILLLLICAQFPTLRMLIPPLPQIIYGLITIVVLWRWALPITMRVARSRYILRNE